MNVIYATENIPDKIQKSLMLCGPTPRDNSIISWRKEALEILASINYDGVVLNPEPRTGIFTAEYYNQIQWEKTALEKADLIIFWVPRSINGGMPGFTTNDEWGQYKASGKVLWGNPPDAEKVKYQRWWAEQLGVPVFDNLEDELKYAVSISNGIIVPNFEDNKTESSNGWKLKTTKNT